MAQTVKIPTYSTQGPEFKLWYEKKSNKSKPKCVDVLPYLK
jgi:hypothetical protein